MFLTRRRSRTAERGYAIALTGLLLVPLMAFAGLVTDLGAWYARAAAIQRAADASALAGVVLLPQGVTAARTRALAVAKQNGFDDADPSITVIANQVTGSRRLQVTISDTDVPQYFTSMFGGSPDLSRTATAEYILPVPMGSPRNFLGTGNDPGNASLIPSTRHENFWVSVSGHCARREHGDRLTPASDANGGSSFAGCVPGNPSNPSGSIRANPEYSAAGYYYGVEFVPAAGDTDGIVDGTYRIQVYDGAHCQFGSGSAASIAGDSGANSGSQRHYEYRFLNPALTPSAATQFGTTQTLRPADCSTYSGNNGWRTLFTIVDPKADRYYLQITPTVPTDKSGSDSQEGQNQLGLRVQTGGSFTPCSTDPTITADYSPFCRANVFGLTHLGVYAEFVGTTPTFFLASVEPEHGGKTMDIELWDTAEGAQTIEILAPNGNRVPFTWEIACQDNSFRSEVGNCTTGENGPISPPGYGPPPLPVNALDVSGTVGTSNRPWGARNEQDGRYSDRLIRLRVALPDDLRAAYGTGTWWRIRYTTCSGTGCSVGDRTTWSVSITGDPVRLVPN